MTGDDTQGQIWSPLFPVGSPPINFQCQKGTWGTARGTADREKLMARAAANKTGTKSKRRSFGRIEQRASGRYRAAFTGPDGHLYRAPSTFDSRDDATAWLAARRAEIQLKIWAPDIVERSIVKTGVPTFEDYARRWVSTRKTKGQPLRPTTRDHYEYVLESTLYPTFGKTALTRSPSRTSTSGTRRSRRAESHNERTPTACCARSSARPPRHGPSR